MNVRMAKGVSKDEVSFLNRPIQFRLRCQSIPAATLIGVIASRKFFIVAIRSDPDMIVNNPGSLAPPGIL